MITSMGLGIEPTPSRVVVRPSLTGSQSPFSGPKAGAAAWVVYLGVAVALVSALAFQGLSRTLRDYTAAAVVLAGSVAVALVLFFVSARLSYDGGRVIRRDLFRRSRSVSVDELQRLTLCSVKSTWNARPLRAIVFVNHDERAALRLSGFFWNADDIAGFAARVGLPLVGSWADVVTAEDLERALPGAVSWVERSRDNSYVGAVLILIGFLAVYFVTRWALGF